MSGTRCQESGSWRLGDAAAGPERGQPDDVGTRTELVVLYAAGSRRPQALSRAKSIRRLGCRLLRYAAC